MQVSAAAREAGRTFIADPPASWLDDFLSWLSPGLPHCCREDPQGQQCPPPDQFPCNTSASACADCATCFTTGSGPDPRVLPHNRPTLQQVILFLHHTVSCESRPAVSARCLNSSFAALSQCCARHSAVVKLSAARSGSNTCGCCCCSCCCTWCSIVHVSVVHLSPPLHERDGVLQCDNMRHAL